MNKLFFLMICFMMQQAFAMDVSHSIDVKFNFKLLNKKKHKKKICQQKLDAISAKCHEKKLVARNSHDLYVFAQDFHFGTNKQEKDLEAAIYFYLVAYKGGCAMAKICLQNLLEDAYDINQESLFNYTEKYTEKKRNKNITEENKMELQALLVLLHQDDLLIEATFELWDQAGEI